MVVGSVEQDTKWRFSCIKFKDLSIAHWPIERSLIKFIYSEKATKKLKKNSCTFFFNIFLAFLQYMNFIKLIKISTLNCAIQFSFRCRICLQQLLPPHLRPLRDRPRVRQWCHSWPRDNHFSTGWSIFWKYLKIMTV